MGVINKEGALYLATGIDNSGFRKDAAEAEGIIDGIGEQAKKAGVLVGSIFAISGVKDFVSKMIQVRGEFQQMDTAIQTLLGSKEKADALMAQVKEFAKISPLEMKDVSSATQMMLGFNIEAEKVPRFLQAIGDVSMGDAGKFNSLTLAFSQMSATSKLMGQDLNQMINAGFNPLATMAEKTGKSISYLKDEMSKGAISAEMVQQAFIDATSEGGKFYKMSENASKTINGQISMLNDAIDAMFNKMGESSEGMISTAIGAATALVENYEKIGKILAVLITTYGAYRAALMVTAATMNGWTLATTLQYKALLLAEKAQKLLNATVLKNPYVAVTVAVVALGSALLAASNHMSAAERAQKKYNKTKEEAIEREREHKDAIEESLSSARDESLATLTRQKSLETLRKEYPKIFEQYDLEKLKLADILNIKRQINEEDSNRSVQSRKDDYESLKKLVEEQKRFVYLYKTPGATKDMTEEDSAIYNKYAYGTSVRSTMGDAYFRGVQRKLKDNLETLKNYEKDIFDDSLAAWQANLSNYSKERLEYSLKMAKSDASKRNGFVIGNKMFKGEYLDSITASLESALLQKKDPNIYKQDFDTAKSEWDASKKALEAINKDKDKYSTEEYKKAKQREEDAENKYKELGGVTGSKLQKEANDTKKIAEEQERYKRLLDQQAIERTRLEQDYQTRIDSERIALMNEGTAKVITQMEHNFEKEMQEIDREKEDAIRDKISNARDAFEANPANNGKKFDASGITLSPEEIAYFDSLYINSMEGYAKKQKEHLQESQSAWNEYHKEYGNYQQKRLAITKEYEQEIAKAEKGSVEEAAATSKRDKAYKELDKSMLEQSDLWKRLFGDANKQTSKFIDQTIKDTQQLIDYLNGVEGAEIPTGFEEKDLESLKKDKDLILTLLNTLIQKKDELNSRNPFKQIINGFKDLSKAADGSNEQFVAMQQVIGGLQGASSIIGDIGNALDKAGSSAGKVLNDISEIVGQTSSMALTGALVGGPVGAAIGAAVGLGTSLLSVFGGAKELSQSTIDSYNAYMDTIDELIEKQKELLASTAGTSTTKLAENILQQIEAQTAAARKMGSDYLNSGAGTFSHSHGYNLAKTLSSYKRELASIGIQYDQLGGRATGLFELDADTLYDLKFTLPEVWAKIDQETRNYLETIISASDQTEELATMMKEAFTGTTFDTLKDSLDDLVKNADLAFSDIQESFENHMSTAILNFVKNEIMQDALKRWYDDFSANMSDGALTNSEATALQSEYERIVREANEAYNMAMNAAGLEAPSSSSQEATKRGFETMSQDTASELNGRFTALQMAGEEIKQNTGVIVMEISELRKIGVSTNETLADLRDIGLDAVYHLEKISKNTALLYITNEKLDKLEKAIKES